MFRLPFRQYTGEVSSLFRDLERVLQEVDGSVSDTATFKANPADWADPAPTTLAEAVARLAAANPGA